MKFSKLFTWICVLLNYIKRCICGRKKTKKDEDDVALPTRIVTKHTSQKPEEEELASWDDWGQNDTSLTGVTVESANNTTEQDKEVDIDLFGDMQPVFQKPKKILVKTRSSEKNDLHQPSDRLKFDSTVPLPQAELGTWTEDTNAWDEISDKEIEWATQNVLKEKRLAEREKRALEQQRKKEERENIRLAKKNTGHLGVKIG